MPWYRPRYRGAAAAQIWVFDFGKKERREIFSDGRQFLFSQFMPSGKAILTVTTGAATPTLAQLGEKPEKFSDNARRAPNLWLADLNGGLKQLTH